MEWITKARSSFEISRITFKLPSGIAKNANVAANTLSRRERSKPLDFRRSKAAGIEKAASIPKYELFLLNCSATQFLC